MGGRTQEKTLDFFAFDFYMKKCTHCKTISQDNAKFCSKCGGTVFEACDVSIKEKECETTKKNIENKGSNEAFDISQIKLAENTSNQAFKSVGSMPNADNKGVVSASNNKSVNSGIQTECAVTEENKLPVAFAWVPVVSWIMYLIKPNDKAVVKASNQGMLLLIADIVIYLFRKIIGWIMLNVSISLTSVKIFSILGWACSVLTFGTFFLALVGFIITLAQSRVFELPGTQKLAIFKTKA